MPRRGFVAAAFHAHMVDSCSSKIEVECFHVRFSGPNGRSHHLLGIREYTDVLPLHLPEQRLPASRLEDSAMQHLQRQIASTNSNQQQQQLSLLNPGQLTDSQSVTLCIDPQSSTIEAACQNFTTALGGSVAPGQVLTSDASFVGAVGLCKLIKGARNEINSLEYSGKAVKFVNLRMPVATPGGPAASKLMDGTMTFVATASGSVKIVATTWMEAAAKAAKVSWYPKLAEQKRKQEEQQE
ncbi:unnamed protein product, partial [Polarella glacialis]